jgi:DNA-binding response OmpR family regulator
VWGLNFDCESNIIDVYVGYLRRKIETDGRAPLLHSVRGVGYVLKADPGHAGSSPRGD